MRIYTIADPHGFLDEMKQALAEKGFFDDPEGKLLICGDVLDRGKQAVEMVDFLMELSKQDRLIFVKGNHEDLLLRCLQDISGGDLYEIAVGVSYQVHNGTWDTLVQLSGLEERMAFRFPEEVVRRVMASPFYETLLPHAVDYYEPKGAPYIFVHGWIPVTEIDYKPYVKYEYDPDWRQADPDKWYKARWFNGMDMACRKHIWEPEKTIVCGHFHTSWGHAMIEKACSEWGKDADFSPFVAEGIIALDACTAHSGRINCMVFEVP